MHEHVHCNHILMYCGRCDVAYCTMCHKEWGARLPYTWSINSGSSTSSDAYVPNVTFSSDSTHLE